jgi:tyrosine-protein phosphatase YwqE
MLCFVVVECNFEHVVAADAHSMDLWLYAVASLGGLVVGCVGFAHKQNISTAGEEKRGRLM